MAEEKKEKEEEIVIDPTMYDQMMPELMPTDLIDNPMFSVGYQDLAAQDFSHNTTAIDRQIANLGPRRGGVIEKQAAYYRLQGEGKVLETRRTLDLLFKPTIKYLTAKSAQDRAKFEALMAVMPEFDDSKIFGQLSNSEIDIAGEAIKISNSVKRDLKKISRMAPGTKKYNKLRQKIESEQGKLVSYDKINQNLLKMRNMGTNRDEWSEMMTDKERRAWEDIYYSKGHNMKIIDGNVYWVDPAGQGGPGGESATIQSAPHLFLDLSKQSSPKMKNNQAVKDHLTVTASTMQYIEAGGTKSGVAWQFQKNKINSYLDGMDNDAIGSLIWDGLNGGNTQYGGLDTTDFVEELMKHTYGKDLDVSEGDVATFIEEMKSHGLDQVYTNAVGEKMSLKQHFRNHYITYHEGLFDEYKQAQVRTSASSGSSQGGPGQGKKGKKGGKGGQKPSTWKEGKVVPWYQHETWGDSTIFDSLTKMKWTEGVDGPNGQYNIFDYEEEEAEEMLNKAYGGYINGEGEHVYYRSGDIDSWAKDPDSIGTFFFEEAGWSGDYMYVYFKTGPGPNDYEKSMELSLDNHDFLKFGEDTEDDVANAEKLQKRMREMVGSTIVDKDATNYSMGNQKNY